MEIVEKKCRCPECGGKNFKRWELPHPMVLHWVLNPGLCFNELVLGQRVPKRQWICQDCDKPLVDRAYVPCLECGTMHLGRRASGKEAFGKWRGVACPSCGEAIPCVWNMFSLLVLAVTFPLWVLPYALWFRGRPLSALFAGGAAGTKLAPPEPSRRRVWVIMGTVWGGAMWVITSLVALLTGEVGEEDRAAFVVAQLPFWALGGALFATLMCLWMGRRPGGTE